MPEHTLQEQLKTLYGRNESTTAHRRTREIANHIRNERKKSSVRIDEPKPMHNYEQKFKGLIAALKGTQPTFPIVVCHVEVLGDNYQEVCESIRRIAASNRALIVWNEKDFLTGDKGGAVTFQRPHLCYRPK